MTSEQPGAPILDLTADGVEFAPWATIVENDILHLGRLSFDMGSPLVTYVQKGLTYSLPPAAVPQFGELEASFVSIDKRAVIRFIFNGVRAFRVLDENGLLELWNASAATPRPGQATFRARGHGWADESVLVFLGEGEKARYSHFVATDDWCLEVVCDSEPEVIKMGPAVVTTSQTKGS